MPINRLKSAGRKTRAPHSERRKCSCVMSTWKRKAIELFSDLRHEVQQSDATICQVFFELLPRARDAYDRGDTGELERIYRFASWCYRQKTEALWNAAAVTFYEHLVDSGTTFEQIPHKLEADIIEGCKGFFAARLKPEEFNRLCGMYYKRRDKAPA